MKRFWRELADWLGTVGLAAIVLTACVPVGWWIAQWLEFWRPLRIWR